MAGMLKPVGRGCAGIAAGSCVEKSWWFRFVLSVANEPVPVVAVPFSSCLTQSIKIYWVNFELSEPAAFKMPLAPVYCEF